MNASYKEYLKEYSLWEDYPSNLAAKEILNFLELRNRINFEDIEQALDNSLSSTTILDANIDMSYYNQFESFTLTPSLLYELCPRNFDNHNVKSVDRIMRGEYKLVLPSFTACKQCTKMIRTLDDLFSYAKEKADAEINHYFHTLNPRRLAISYFSKNDYNKSNTLSFTFVDNINEALEAMQYFCAKQNGRYNDDAKLIQVVSNGNLLHELLTRDRQLAVSVCANTLYKLKFKNNVNN